MSTNKIGDKPNIIFFMVDQLSAKWLEAAMDGICPLPHFERLRQEGVNFNNAISSNPVCCPARATLATGFTTRQHGVLENGYQLDPEIPTFMQLLQQNGWKTGAFGKVHFKPHFAGVYPDYKPYGFDVTHITEDARAGEWLDWVEKEHPEHYDAALATIWATGLPDLINYGPRGIDLRQSVIAAREKFNLGHAYPLPFPEEVSQTAWITAHALEFLQTTDKAQPVYAHISYVQPHSPFAPPGDYLQYVKVEKLPHPAPAEWIDDPLMPKWFETFLRDGKPLHSVEWWMEQRHHYFADLIHLDSKLGLVIEALEKTGRWENSYLIFLSDHGEILGDHALGSKEEKHYDTCIRVPLMIAGPQLQKGIVRSDLVQLEDIFPTVMEMAAVEPLSPKVMGPYIKDKPTSFYSGNSLLGLCRGETLKSWRQTAYCESYNPIFTSSIKTWARTVRTHEYRYTRYPQGNGEQLFNLKDDPDEQRNLAGDSAYDHIRRKLRDELLELLILQDYPQTIRELFARGVH